MFSRTSFPSVQASLCVFSMILCSQTAQATSYWRTVEHNAIVVADTFRGDASPSEEAERIGVNWDEYNDQKATAQIFSVPQVQLNGEYPVFAYSAQGLGTNVVAQFIFIDPRTGAPTTSGFD